MRKRVWAVTLWVSLAATAGLAMAQPQPPSRPVSSPSATPKPTPQVPPPQQPGPTSSPPPAAQPAGPTYQVIVTQTSDTALRTVQGLEGSAYRGSFQGQAVIFAGVYRDLSNASQISARLTQAGLNSLVVRRQPPSYRVAVLVPDSQTVGQLRASLRQIQGIVPDAYLDTFQEQSVIVAGQFRDARSANALASRLQSLGFPPLLITIPEGETVLLPQAR